MTDRFRARGNAAIAVAILVLVGDASADPRRDTDSDSLALPSNCDAGSAEASMAYEAYRDCPRAADPTDIAQIDACLAMARRTLAVLERVAAICSEAAVSPAGFPVERTRLDVVEQIALMERLQQYNRGEIDSGEMAKYMLKHERRHRSYRK